MNDLLGFFSKVLEFLFSDTETRVESLFLLHKEFLTTRANESLSLAVQLVRFSPENLKTRLICAQRCGLKSHVDEDK